MPKHEEIGSSLKATNVSPHELTEAELAMRQHQTSFLLEGPEVLIRQDEERKKIRNQEVIELRSGELITFETYLADGLREYFPIFPNSNPFFSEMFRLVGNRWKGWNPHAYTKPLEAKIYLIEIIYYRFSRQAIATLKSKVKRGRSHKLFQLLNEEGLDKVIQFRDEAVAMMKEYKDGSIYEFRVAYANRFKTPMQLELGK